MINYAGELQSVDGYMNIALEKTEEYVNGAKRRSYGDAFVRGNNGWSHLIGALARGELLTQCRSYVHLSRLIAVHFKYERFGSAEPRFCELEFHTSYHMAMCARSISCSSSGNPLEPDGTSSWQLLWVPPRQ